MNATQTDLLCLLRRALFGGECAPLTAADWDALLCEANAHAVTLLVYDAISAEERKQMSPEQADAWQCAALSGLKKNEAILREQTEIFAALHRAQIAGVLIKGSSSALCYPKPELRTAGDIDLLFAPEDVSRAEELFVRCGGYTSPKEEHSCHRAMKRDNMTVELHFEPNGIPEGEKGDFLRRYFAQAQKEPVLWEGIPILSKAPRAMLMLLHMFEHIVETGIGLRQFCDWACFLQKEMTAELWTELETILRASGFLRFAKIATRTTLRLFAMEGEVAPWCADADLSLCDTLTAYIFESGNFGKKDERYGQRFFSDMESRSFLGGLWRQIKVSCYAHFPACKRHPALLAVAPIAVLIRYLCLYLAGKRPAAHVGAMYRRGSERQKFYHAIYDEDGE